MYEFVYACIDVGLFVRISAYEFVDHIHVCACVNAIAMYTF